MNYCFIHDTPIGELILEANLDYLTKISFRGKMLNQVKASSLHRKNLILEKTVEQLDEYFFDNRRFFTINYFLNTTVFFKKVLLEVSLINFGKVKSYKQIAALLKNKNAYRSVANANARNPLPIIIPCHRVIRSSGEVGGYAGGIPKKKYLLSLENKTVNFY
ncbi:MAG: methylated-DNA--[protein]-cysteine S-methyltransferase [Candidatus Neomarinimicrobiota bacterium]